MLLPQQNPIDATLPQAFPVEDAHGWAFELGDLLDALFTPGHPSPPRDGKQSLDRARVDRRRLDRSPDRLRRRQLPAMGPHHARHRADHPARDAPLLRRRRPRRRNALPDDHPGGGPTRSRRRFHADVATELQLADAEFSEGLRQTLDAAFARGDRSIGGWIEAMIYAVIGVVLSWSSTMFFGFLFRMAFLLLYAVCLAQVLWAQLALGILVYLGPVLIPWLVWKPMAWLFWGWFRAIWTYSFYSIIAAAVLRVYGAIAITMIETLNTGFLTGGSSDRWAGGRSSPHGHSPARRRRVHGRPEGPRARLRHRRRGRRAAASPASPRWP